MASIFKQQYTEKDRETGERVRKKSKCWYIEYTTADGIRKRIKAFKDKTATTQLAAKLEREAELEQAGVIDRFREHRKTPLLKHLKDFKQSMLDTGNTEKHTTMTYMRAKTIIENTGFIRLADIQPSRVLNVLAKLKNTKTGELLSIMSRNYYLKAFKQFLNWLISDNRADVNPIAHLKCQNAEKDIRKKRRALTNTELEKLISAAMDSDEHYQLTGRQRAMLYLLAVNTGLRANEIATLTWIALDLDSNSPTVTVKAAYSKHRREDVLPLRAEIASMFKELREQIEPEPDSRIFNVSKCISWARMIYKDLELAGIERIDDSGRSIDFHALRHTFITNLVKGGASPKVAQGLARHSKITLTMDTYTHISLNDHRGALDLLPEINLNDDNKPYRQQSEVKKTGTDDQPVVPYRPAYRELTGKADSGCDQSATIGTDKEA
ncbi:MAG: site-specific integrase, partial [Planctomycetes bacterium]|nr:site-specific integrase [Planctomycetota bacterium]